MSDYSSAATAQSGQSYVSSTGASWTDLTTQSGYGDANVCLKAYVEPAQPSGDRTPPMVAASGFDGRWHNRPVTVTLTGSDTGSGMACIWYSAGGRPWYQVMGAGAQVTIPAPADHSWDGVNEVQYYGVDNAGNQPGVVSKDCHVMIDTRRPTTRAARRVSVRRGRTAKLAYRVVDQVPSGGRATVTIRIRKSGGRAVKTLRLARRPVNVNLTAKFRCKLARGAYRYYVYARDSAGNSQRRVGSAAIRVR